ncbi:vanadium-dependent haloperoxidase [Paraflavitalea pollutisoli]|uniref:vanadium-dependent haloperoxidase n=1 Tax=Paraflavitalea pollutisoli TaxID=3034143 RepID=UPI0023ECE5E0|nr:vanadium-dependent haloperoxidase [Paraflavitalea sp. H1-2-19X]
MTFRTYKGNRRLIACVLPVALLITLLTGCNKLDDFWGHGKPGAPTTYSSDVIEQWMSLQLRLMKNATGIPNHGFSRPYAYAGIAAWESIAEGVPGSGQWAKQWNGLTGLPAATGSSKFYWPASANAALASINRSLFPNATAADKSAIDSLEQLLRTQFLAKAPSNKVNAAADYGKLIAGAVFAWSETDGYKNASRPYVVPTGPGKWKPTPPAFGAPATPYWGENRPIVKGSLTNTQAPAPIAYSTDPQSPFYKMVKKVYDVSQGLTTDQINMAFYWRDVPGVSSPGHWLSILLQTLQKKQVSMAKAALAYALSGAAGNDALISCFQVKYQYNQVRPITYIHEVIGITTWNPTLATPAHPEYPSAHSALSGGTATVLESLFPGVHSITDHTYDYLNFGARTYSSFTAVAKEAAQSRLYGGIHYEQSNDAGLQQGFKTGENVLIKSLPSSFIIE